MRTHIHRPALILCLVAGFRVSVCVLCGRVDGCGSRVEGGGDTARHWSCVGLWDLGFIGVWIHSDYAKQPSLCVLCVVTGPELEVEE